VKESSSHADGERRRRCPSLDNQARRSRSDCLFA
jgi:hypothetical protein